MSAPYLDPRFDRASQLVRAVVERSDAEALRVVRRGRHDLADLVRLWQDLDVVRPEVPAADASAFDDILRATATCGVLGLEPIAVLHIPEDPVGYTTGRRKQAMRTNLRAARDLGCRAVMVSEADRDEWNRRLIALLRPDAPAELRDWPIARGAAHSAVVGLDATGTLVGVAVARAFGPWAVLEMALRLGVDRSCSLSRYLVQRELVEQLRSKGVRHLTAGCAFRISAGLQYLQYVLGYDPARVIPTTASTTAPATCAVLAADLQHERSWPPGAAAALRRARLVLPARPRRGPAS